MIEFIVNGDPVPKARARVYSRGGITRAYTPGKTADYESQVRNSGLIAMEGFDVMNGAVSMQLYVYLKIPKSWTKSKKILAIDGSIRPTSKPDLDNICKSVTDALNEVVYKDDSQITTIFMSKQYSLNPHIRIKIVPTPI